MKLEEFASVAPAGNKVRNVFQVALGLKVASCCPKQLTLSIKSLLVTLKCEDAQSRGPSAADSSQVQERHRFQGNQHLWSSFAGAHWKKASFRHLYGADPQWLLGSGRDVVEASVLHFEYSCQGGWRRHAVKCLKTPPPTVTESSFFHSSLVDHLPPGLTSKTGFLSSARESVHLQPACPPSCTVTAFLPHLGFAVAHSPQARSPASCLHPLEFQQHKVENKGRLHSIQVYYKNNSWSNDIGTMEGPKLIRDSCSALCFLSPEQDQSSRSALLVGGGPESLQDGTAAKWRRHSGYPCWKSSGSGVTVFHRPNPPSTQPGRQHCHVLVPAVATTAPSAARR
ncbi:uncharacterized protein LOC116659982 [Camelus ferus]|uniref:Uncharacterized protein LOC116659982 n=1 Tax=Camelus ferus TaxID=419612 RepID=A0A8B8S3H3_CAMFR|nr:uncharacterized protein LOC116659982 [Camelus ferus]